jgi:hypothetical protein
MVVGWVDGRQQQQPRLHLFYHSSLLFVIRLGQQNSFFFFVFFAIHGFLLKKEDEGLNLTKTNRMDAKRGDTTIFKFNSLRLLECDKCVKEPLLSLLL